MRRFHFKHFSLYHHQSTMKVGTDAVLLGAWVKVQPTDCVLDIGTGCGILPLMLAQKGVAKVDAVDLDEASAYEASANFEASQWRDRLNAYHADIRRFGFGRSYDLILSNPPFFVHSFKCDADRKNQARHTDTSLTFEELVVSVKRLLKPEGRFVLVLPERESHDFLPLANAHGLFVHERLDLIPVVGKEVNRVNLELRYGKPEETRVATLVLRDADNRFSDEYNALLKDFYLG
ncbi:MAG: methyltransferase [Bacteroidales bacterium]|nr:methyltransferase [Bacteroidales bacterium]